MEVESPSLLFLITEDWYFWSHRLDLARAARDSGWKVLIATRVTDHGKRIEDEGFKLIPIRFVRRSRNPIREMFTIHELIRLYRQERPNVVYHVAMKPIIYGSWAARYARIPAVVNAFAGLGHVFIDNELGSAFSRFVLVRMLRHVLALPDSRVIFQNEEDLEQLIQSRVVKPDQSIVIRGAGVDTSKFSPSPECDGDPVVILPSRMLWNKGVGEFVAAARILKKQNGKTRYILVGMVDKENPSHIPESRILAWQEEGVIEWWGHREDMPSVLGSSHVVVLPTYYGEGLPKVLLEAASCGKPIVATQMRGVRDIVRDRENGLLVPPRDSQSLAKAIGMLVEDPALRAQMGYRGREIVVKDFSIQKIAEQTLALYRGLLRDHSRSSDYVSAQ